MRKFLVALMLFAQAAVADDMIVENKSFTPDTTTQTSCDCQDLQQWHLDFTHARQAWDITMGIQSFKVGIISTGVDTLAWELGGTGIPGVSGDPCIHRNMWINPGEVYDGIDNDGNGYVDDVRGMNFTNYTAPTNIIAEYGFTGTLMATVMAANDPAMSYRGVGICPKVTIVPVKWYDGGIAGNAYSIAAAMHYARTVGCRIVVCHSGSGDPFQPIKDEIAANTAAGMLTIWAAGGGIGGDGNLDVCAEPCHFDGPAYPMKYNDPGLLVVTASSLIDGFGFQDAIIPGGTNWGPVSVDLAAATYYANTIHPINPVSSRNVFTTGPGEGWGYWTGSGNTNAAAAMVAGAAAQVWSLHSNWTVAQVKQAIMSTVDTYPGQSGKTVTGGLLNVLRAVQYGGGGGEIESMHPTVEETTPRTTVFSISEANRMIASGRVAFYDISGRKVDSVRPGMYFVDKRTVVVTR
jgi:hypothetical protein